MLDFSIQSLGASVQNMIEEHVSLKPYSHYTIGGTARYFCRADGLHSLIEAVRFARRKKLPLFILGGGTNVLFKDNGFKGLVIKPDLCFITAVPALPETMALTVGAGVAISDFLDFCVERGFSGFEWAGGLPGTLGGAIRGNAGAFKGEIKDSLVEVVSLVIDGEPRLIKRDCAECVFGYRDSIFKARDGKEIILAATFMLLPGNRTGIRAAIEEKIAWRKNRQPLEYPNVGSIFKNVAWNRTPASIQNNEDIKRHVKNDPFPVIPAACLIDKAGLKGVSCGGAMVSQKHPNFIVNVGGAEEIHVRQLIMLVKAEVKKKFDIDLEEEIVFV